MDIVVDKPARVSKIWQALLDVEGKGEVVCSVKEINEKNTSGQNMEKSLEKEAS